MSNQKDQREAREGSEGAKELDDKAGMSPVARIWTDLGPYLTIAWVFALSIALFAWLGYKLDAWLGTGRKIFIVGCVFGIAVGFLNFFKVVLLMSQRKGQ